MITAPRREWTGRFWRASMALAFGVALTLPGRAQTQSESGDQSLMLDGAAWKLAPADEVAVAPEKVASADYDDSKWLAAVVPGTVLTSYVAAGRVSDPWFGDAMDQLSEAPFDRDFWYRINVNVPDRFQHRRVWLEFAGVNWNADAYLNGRKLGTVAGAFTRARFDVSAVARCGQPNTLAVLIHRVAHPGPGPEKVVRKKLGSPTTNGDVLGYDSPTFVASAGWNWLPIIRGRNIGIWNSVGFRASGDVTVDDPWVTTERIAPDGSTADIAIHADLHNRSREAAAARVVAVVDGQRWEFPVTLPARGGESFTWKVTAGHALSLPQPRLWWPNGYGEQPLYDLRISVEAGGRVSDAKVVRFGVRTIDYRIADNVLRLAVNGRPIQCRGGNWGMDEGMLRCDAVGYDLRVRLHHDAHLNMIRNWVGMVGREAFYDACDRYGILVWDDFWLANPANGPDPLDHPLFLANARDKIRRVRSHPSVALYCGRNEGYPPADLDLGMRGAVVALDNTRLYIPHSAAGLVTGFGPYIVQDVAWYFAHTGRTLHSELGIVAVPAVESMRAMLPTAAQWPINDLWAVHDYQSPRAPLYTTRLEQRYGRATSLEDYCAKAQLLNLETAKAMYEALRANRGSGTLVWMTNPAWPSVICQLYDYYFEPTGAYFGAKTACEPLHVFWNAETDVIEVANDTLNDRRDLQVEATVYALDGTVRWHQTAPLSVPANTATSWQKLTRPRDGPWFLRLVLRRDGQPVSENFYWSDGGNGSCAPLMSLSPTALSLSAAATSSTTTIRIAVDVANSGPVVALAARLQVIAGGERVLPVLYSDNYVSLAPGEHRRLSLEVPRAAIHGGQPSIRVSAINAPPQDIPCPVP